MKIIFELTMPNVGSWNGRWTGENDKYTVLKKISKTYLKGAPHRKEILDALENNKSISYYYSFGDGWGAQVTVRNPEYRERPTNRFCGYEWMIESIIDKGKIEYSKKKD